MMTGGAAANGGLERLRRAAVGFGVDEAAALDAADEPTLFGLIVDTFVRLGERRSFEDYVAGSGIDPRYARRTWRAFGHPDPPERGITEGEGDALALVDTARSLLGAEEAICLAWAMGAGAREMAETLVAALEFALPWPRTGGQTPRHELAAFFKELATDLMPRLSRAMDVLIRAHIADLVPYDWPAHDTDLPARELAVGAIRFARSPTAKAAALVEQLPTEFSAAVRASAFVRFTGDGALFAAEDAEQGCALARDVIGLRALEPLRPAAGLEWGGVSTRHGGVFGPVVGTAMRIARQADPGEVLVGPGIVGAARHTSFSFRETPISVLRGIDGTVKVFRLEKPS